MYFVSESKSVAVKCSVKPRCSIDEKGRLSHLMFLAEFVQKHLGERLCSGRKEPGVEIFLRMRIDHGVQPVTLIVDLDHGFINSDVIRILSVSGL